MNTEDYNYDLPPELIAKTPLAQRDKCRLLHLDKTSGAISHLMFGDIFGILKKGDRLVFNDTRVIPARVFCSKEGSGGAVELFFTEIIDACRWKVLAKPGKRARAGTVLCVDGCPQIKIRVDDVLADGYERTVSLLDGGGAVNTLYDVIESHGHIPLPHYMERDDEASDREMYQTVYAKCPGAVAAPTAGLHFTNDMLDKLADYGIDKSFVTLHVGIGTFRPVQVSDPRLHDIHEERFELSEETARDINETWQRGGRVIAVGTTVVRTLESCAVSKHKVVHGGGKTKLMILPPYEFKAVDGLITNFHLPKSTLLMLVSAFAGRENVLRAYQEAIEKQYRFYSYGDASVYA